MAVSTHKFQAPKGTRDFYPDDMAVRRHIESAWRGVSIDHGYDEVEGPTFEHLELYTAKSGPGIVSELFSFRRADGDTDYALRPEFTPTLARMVAARGTSLPMPVKWFSIPCMFRAERPQRGRLREHVQWNADFMGEAGPTAEAEIISACCGVLDRLGLTPAAVAVRISDRSVIESWLTRRGVPTERHDEVFGLLDRRAKTKPDAFIDSARSLGLDESALGELDAAAAAAGTDPRRVLETIAPGDTVAVPRLVDLFDRLAADGLADWARLDLGIVRGLAYYTSTVFEVHETSGRERAVAGGGRYDHLVELFGGPSIPAVGIAMGDVVLRLVLEDNGLLEPGEHYQPRPDAFVISAGNDEAEQQLPGLVARLRRSGLHVRHSYRTTRNVGRLLGEASRTRARCAVILGQELADGHVVVKQLESGEQSTVALDSLEAALRGDG